MYTYVKKSLYATVIGILMILSMVFTAPVYASDVAPFDEVCQGQAAKTTVCADRGNDNRLLNTLEAIINLLLLVAGVVATIMVIVGGLRYVTSGGDSSNTKAAKDTVLYAVIGLVVTIMSYAIVNFVLDRL